MRLALLASILIIFTFTQCEKVTNADLKSEQTRVDMKLINEVRQVSSQNDQRLAYNLLTPAEKAIMWKLKLTDILKTDTLNYDQRAHIERLNSFIKTSIFENANEKDMNVIAFAKSWCIDGLNYFTKEEIVKIAFNIGNTNLDNKNIITVSNSLKTAPGGPPKLDCNCCSTSAFSCNSCDTGFNCKEVTSCGFLFLYTCDGRCSLAV